ncbi:hypothetical protein [Halorussus salinus]|uniref:hypothetical protein n=1 Tax=Halorussus salinus TaxID=1364935 RepID=UPI0010920DCE|nr:hypothetical protein [Halorussus salinus]
MTGNTVNGAKLTVPNVDVNGDGEMETGVFVMRDVEIDFSVRTEFAVGGRGGEANTAISELVGDGESTRKGIHLDAGTGDHVVDISFSGWRGSDGQWGDTGDPTELTPSDATGEEPVTQMQMLDRYLSVGEVDSTNPAELEVGQYTSDGVWDTPALGVDHLDVVVKGPENAYATDRPSTYDGTITCVETTDLSRPLDATRRNDY